MDLLLACFQDQQSTLSDLQGVYLCRAKFGETAYLNVYQKLYEAPDPAPSLSTAMVRFNPAALLYLQHGMQMQQICCDDQDRELATLL